MKCYVCGKTSKAQCTLCGRQVCRLHFSLYYDETKRDMTVLCGNCAQTKRRQALSEEQ